MFKCANSHIIHGTVKSVLVTVYCVCTPVSYTHLDVYKRQPHNWNSFSELCSNKQILVYFPHLIFHHEIFGLQRYKQFINIHKLERHAADVLTTHKWAQDIAIVACFIVLFVSYINKNELKILKKKRVLRTNKMQ